MWYTRLREALDAFVDVTQQQVSGTVRLKLYKGNLILAGRRVPRASTARTMPPSAKRTSTTRRMRKASIRAVRAAAQG